MFRRQAASGQPASSSLFKWRFSRLSQSSQNLTSGDSEVNRGQSSKKVSAGHSHAQSRGAPCLRSVKQRRSSGDSTSEGISERQTGKQLCDAKLQEKMKEQQKKAATLPASAFAPPDTKFSSVVRVECASGAVLVRATLERLLLSADNWPPAHPANSSSQASLVLSVRSELANMKLMAELAKVRLMGGVGDAEDAGLCARRLSGCCVKLLEQAHSLAYQRLCHLPAAAPAEQGHLCRSKVMRSCERLLSAAFGLELAPADSPAIIGQCEMASESLAELAEACKIPAAACCEQADREALQLCIRSVTACCALLLHSVRSSHNRPADPDSRGRVDAAACSLRPAVAALAAVASERRFSGRPLRLAAGSAQRRVSELCRFLPIAACAADLLAELGAAEQRPARVDELVAGLVAACDECDRWLLLQPE